MSRWSQWKEWVRSLKREVLILYLAYRDPRTPWYAKLVVGMVVAYALSPIDLIPDPIPVLGYLDDLVLLPLGILLARQLIPVDVMDDCRRQAEVQDWPKVNWVAGSIIVLIWLLTLAGVAYFIFLNNWAIAKCDSNSL